MGAENLAPTGFDPRTVHPVAIRYTTTLFRPIFKGLTEITKKKTLQSVVELTQLTHDTQLTNIVMELSAAEGKRCPNTNDKKLY
jgi:hypothetical protein